MKNATHHSIFQIFPDHCSTGVWMIAPGDDWHSSCDLKELPLALNPRILKKIDIMNQSYELFCDAGCFPHPTIVEEESFDFMVFDIYQDIRKTHPDFAHYFVIHPQYEELFAQYDKQQIEMHINSSNRGDRKKVI